MRKYERPREASASRGRVVPYPRIPVSPYPRPSPQLWLLHSRTHDQLQVHAGGGVAGHGAGDEVGAGAVGEEGEVVGVAGQDAGVGVLRLGTGEDGAAGDERNRISRGDDTRGVGGGVGVAEADFDAPAE